MEHRLTTLSAANALVLTTGLLGCSCAASSPRSTTRELHRAGHQNDRDRADSEDGDPDSGHYYSVILIWLRDAPMFRQYQKQVRPIAARYGALDRTIAPSALYGDGVDKPDLLNVVHYHGRGGVEALQADSDFQHVVPMRSASIEMASASGVSELARLSAQPTTERVYLVEIARLGPGGSADYERYAARAEAAMKPYGYRVELVMRPDHHSELPFTPDLVKVAYFDDAAGLEAFHRDPAHADLERSYNDVVAESLWVIGTISRDWEPRPE